MVCTCCLRINRVPPNRRESKPRCGNCAARLLPDNAFSLDWPRFQRVVEFTDLPVVACFIESDLPPGDAVAAAFEAAACELRAEALLGYIVAESTTMLSGRRTPRIPTVVVYRQRREAGRARVGVDASGLKEWIATSVRFEKVK